jgi:hypothetical protein
MLCKLEARKKCEKYRFHFSLFEFISIKKSFGSVLCLVNRKAEMKSKIGEVCPIVFDDGSRKWIKKGKEVIVNALNE